MKSNGPARGDRTLSVLIDEFLAPHILVVSGKGGVGKTTAAGALALLAARHGRRVCVAEVDRKGSLSRLLGSTSEPGYEPQELLPGIFGLNITAEEALIEYLEVQYGMRRISKVFTSTHFVDYIATAAPGLEDILTLGKVWYLEQGRGSDHRFDVIVVDAPAAGHMKTFLSSPAGLSDAVQVGPLRRQAEWLRAMLADPARSRIHLVALAEEMPVAETLETAESLRSDIGLTIGAVFANAVYPPLLNKKETALLGELVQDGDGKELVGAAKTVGLELDQHDLRVLLGYREFLEARRAVQAPHLRRLKRNLAGPVMVLPFLYSAGLELPDVETLADVIENQVDEL